MRLVVVDYSHLKSCLVRDQTQVFPTGEEIMQQVGPECVIWVTMDALAAYFQIDVAESNMYKTTSMLNQGRYHFCKEVMGNRLSSHSWLKVSDKVIKGLPGVFKLVDDLLIGGHNYKELAERVEGLLIRCRRASRTLASNKVQVGKKVSFAGYVIEGSTQYADPQKVEAITKFPILICQRELRAGWVYATN